MVVTATGNGLSATKTYAWTVSSVPALPAHAITASGLNKASHVGWARPSLTWSLVTAGSGGFSSGGDLIVPRGKGRIRFIGTLAVDRPSRIVSDLRGVLATGSGTSQNYRTDSLVFSQGEAIFLEIDGYNGTASDSLLLSTDLT